MGKSFEIRPTGVAHAELLLPERWGPDYPKGTGKRGKGKVVEHYSWKKVITNVSGFILGSPTIDHYGDMIVGSYSIPFTLCFSDFIRIDHQSSYPGSMPAHLQA